VTKQVLPLCALFFLIIFGDSAPADGAEGVVLKEVFRRIAEFKQTHNSQWLEAALESAQSIAEDIQKPDWPVHREEKLHALIAVLNCIYSSSDPNFKLSDDPNYDSPALRAMHKAKRTDPEYEEAAQRYREQITEFRHKKTVFRMKAYVTEFTIGFIKRTYEGRERAKAVSIAKQELEDKAAFAALVEEMKKKKSD